MSNFIKLETGEVINIAEVDFVEQLFGQTEQTRIKFKSGNSLVTFNSPTDVLAAIEKGKE